MRKGTLALIGAAFAALVAAPAMADSLPSSKVAIMEGDLFGLGATACATAGTADACTVDDDSGFVTVMSSFIKTPNGKELAFDVALQCGLVTFTQVKVSGPSGASLEDTAAASGRIQVRVKVTEVDNSGDPVAGGEVWYAHPQDDGAAPDAGPPATDDGVDGVTYCYRFQQMKLTTNELACFDGDDTNDDATCEITLSLLLRTLDAHAFNYILTNLPSGPKMIEVQARATAAADVFGGLGAAKGEAFVGVGSTLVETVHAVHAYDADTAGPIVEFSDLQ